MKSRGACLFTVAIAVLSLSMHAARAEDYPARPIKLVVGAPAGGTTDTIARFISEPMAAALKQPVLVENRPGAGGNLAAAAVAKSPPDGYTLLVSFSSHTINATLYPTLPYDPVADFTPITMVARVPSLLVGRADLPAKDLGALIELAKAKPHKLTIGIGGIGSSLHLAGEKFKLMTGVDLLNVPYKGTAPALSDLLGGQIDLMFISLVTGAEQVRAGKLRAYGVTSLQRQASFPEVPTIGEVVVGFESSAWFGVFAPANLPGAVTERLNSVIVAALAEPKL
ncbi:MAG TPA: tripartite tricarboxylate transporter substrate-binding protein, partial [Bradyrhizobium sp.]|nr:tripartite tricarboxylate transporter substrate-binding protein [Bradyrhizobium sp.]